MALDGLTNLYVTCNSNTVSESPRLVVSSTVGVITNAGVNLRGITVMDNGQLALTDAGNNGIWLMNLANGVATQFTGFHGAGDITGPGSSPPSIIRKTSPRPTAVGWLWPTATTTKSKRLMLPANVYVSGRQIQPLDRLPARRDWWTAWSQ